MLSVNERRLWDSHMAMGAIGALSNGGCCRLALTDEDKEARNLFIRWCREAGCTIRIDDAGNIFARRPGLDDRLPAVATGSHLDTQPHAGLFDGIYGVLAGLEIFRTLDDAGVVTRAPIETVVWTNEECVRFAPPTGGSMVFAGLLPIEQFQTERTTDDTTVREDLERLGFLGAPLGHDGHRFDSFFEAHIEQGPILEHEGMTIGAVTGIQGARMFEVRVLGQDNHAGTTPMGMRRDAFNGAARMAALLNELANREDSAIRLTIGRFDVSPNAASTVPGAVTFQIDLRHPQQAVLDRVEVALRDILDETARELALDLIVSDICAIPPVHFDEALIGLVEEKARLLGLPAMRMLSGAGHDSANLAEIVSTTMIFVPCAGGISHNEAESATPSDLAAGANVLLHAMVERAVMV
jgi:beta-ureidopropionase / N-carbamoyl-L-amino-acid hydrolase